MAGTPAATAEVLMRSRYTAFVVGNVDYLEETNSPRAAEGFGRDELEQQLPETEWLGLEIRGTQDGGEADATGTVSFVATYRVQGQVFRQAEVSRFIRIDGKWRYDWGDVREDKPQPRRVQQVGRNEPCPCGSGAKYKKCCGK